jgi:xanthine dehydrogenase small subunit
MIRFVLNGQKRVLEGLEPGRTVLEHLRLHERLTATKEGCAEGDCGACTIVIGRPEDAAGLKFQAVNACIMLASELDGLVALTADGLAQDNVLEQTQRAMVEHHGSQCGFCTPGIVMSLFAYTQTPEIDGAEARRAAIYDALAGNLCRCTGYRPIMDAAQRLHHGEDKRASAWRAMLDELETEPDASAPRTMEALDALLAAKPGATLLGGGTDLGVAIAKHGRVPAAMISLRQVAGLNTITETDDALRIGASATYSEILPYLDRHFPAFAGLVRRIGSVQIRNMGTMGGNVCNASPIGDSAPCLLALEARFWLRSASGKRILKAEAFFIDYRKTALLAGEYLEAIEIPYVKPAEQFFAYKIAKRVDQDISTLAAAFWLRLDGDQMADVRAGFGGMAATPKRAKAVEKALQCVSLSDAAFAVAAAALAQDFAPLSDFRAPAEYRLQAAAGLLARLGAALMEPEMATDIWAL